MLRAKHLLFGGVGRLHPSVPKAHRRRDDVLYRPLAGSVLYDSWLVEQYDSRFRCPLSLPSQDDAFSLRVVDDQGRTEFAERPVIHSKHTYERTGIVGCPRRVESNEQGPHDEMFRTAFSNDHTSARNLEHSFERVLPHSRIIIASLLLA